jgi:hypothetical protein
MAPLVRGLRCSTAMVPPGRQLRCFAAMVLSGRRLCCSVAMASSGRRLCYFATMALGTTKNFVFFLLGNFNGLFYAREKENDKLLHVQERKRKREPKIESFETCLVSFFSAVGSPPPILAMLVGSQKHKLPSTSFLWLAPSGGTSRTTTIAKRNSKTQNQKKIVAFNIK